MKKKNHSISLNLNFSQKNKDNNKKKNKSISLNLNFSQKN